MYDYRYILKKSKQSILLKIPAKKIKSTGVLEFSVWLKVTDAHASFPVIECRAISKTDTTCKAEGVGYSTDIYKNYVRAKILIQTKDSDEILEFSLSGKDIIPGRMLLRNMDKDVFLIQRNGMLMKNNFYLDDRVKLFEGYK